MKYFHLWRPVMVAVLFPGMLHATPAEDADFAAAIVNTGPTTLTLAQAEMMATANHPRLAASEAEAKASQQGIREARSAFFPQVEADAGAFDVTHDHSELAATGGLQDSSIDTRQSDGLLASQLITDFGRTASLTAQAKYNAGAAAANAATTRAQVLRDVDQAYFFALEAQDLMRVADETYSDRKLILDRVSALAQGKLKSELDVSFAQVDLNNAELLQLEANDRLNRAFANLSNALGYKEQRAFQLVDASSFSAPVSDFKPLLEHAFANRPEITSLQQQYQAALKFASAQRDAQYPTVEALAATGISPIRDGAHLNDTYAAAGVNLSLPLLTGGRLSAAVAAADLKATETQRLLQSEQNDVGRDVRNAWLAAVTAYKKIGVSEKLLASAIEAQDLAQARYTSGLSSIVELSQAQLNKTQAEIDVASAGYGYQILAAALKYELGDFGK